MSRKKKKQIINDVASPQPIQVACIFKIKAYKEHINKTFFCYMSYFWVILLSRTYKHVRFN